MSEKTTQTLPVWAKAFHACLSAANAVKEWQRKRSIEEEYQRHLANYKNHPVRLEMNRFELRMKAIRCGQIEPTTPLEKEWKRYNRDFFYAELRRKYRRRGLEHDVDRLHEEEVEGATVQQDVKDDNGKLVGTETLSENEKLPIRQLELSVRKSK